MFYLVSAWSHCLATPIFIAGEGGQSKVIPRSLGPKYSTWLHVLCVGPCCVALRPNCLCLDLLMATCSCECRLHDVSVRCVLDFLLVLLKEVFSLGCIQCILSFPKGKFRCRIRALIRYQYYGVQKSQHTLTQRFVGHALLWGFEIF